MLKFEEPRIMIEKFGVQDVITTSGGCDGYDPDAGEEDEW